MYMSRRSFLGLGVSASGLALSSAVLPARASVLSAAVTGARFSGDPGPGRLYYGASLAKDLATWERELPRRLTVHRTYFKSWESDRLISVVKSGLQYGRLPHPSIKPPGTWRSVGDGYHDGWLYGLADRLGGIDNPVFFTVQHEPEDDDGGIGMHPFGFRKMTSHVIRVMQERAPKVTVVPTLMGWSFSPYCSFDPSRWLVPEAAVLGLDMYNPWSPTNGLPWVTFAERLERVKPYAAGRPIVIAEYGCRTDPQNPGRAAAWMWDAFTYARNNNVVCMSYFNSGCNSPDGTWELDSEREPVFKQQLDSAAVAQL